MINSELPYRKNVLGIFVNSNRLVLAVERNDVPGAWQLPQGGIEDGESETDAFLREMSEELGVPQNTIEIIARMPETIKYDFPNWVRKRADWLQNFRGQEQTVFLARLKRGVKPSLEKSDGENTAFKWVEFDFLINSIVDFKRAAYKQIYHWFNKQMKDWKP